MKPSGNLHLVGSINVGSINVGSINVGSINVGSINVGSINLPLDRCFIFLYHATNKIHTIARSLSEQLRFCDARFFIGKPTAKHCKNMVPGREQESIEADQWHPIHSLTAIHSLAAIINSLHHASWLARVFGKISSGRFSGLPTRYWIVSPLPPKPHRDLDYPVVWGYPDKPWADEHCQHLFHR